MTFTDPEPARIGLTEAEARETHGDGVRVVRSPELDRARIDGRIDGIIKLVVDKRGRTLVATILGEHAGELIHVWSLAMSRKLSLRTIGSAIVPYPTLGDISKMAASAFYAEKLFSTWTRRLVRLLALFG